MALNDAARPLSRSPWLVPLAQAAAGLLVAAPSAALAGWQAAHAAIVGAGVIAAGFAVFGWRTQARPGVVSAQRAFVRLLLGTLLKWLVIGAGLVLAMASGQFEAAFVLTGALVALLAYYLCLPWLLR